MDSGLSDPGPFCGRPAGFVTFGRRAQKRILDLVCASLLFLFFAPVMAIIAIAIKLDSPGPILFRQQRHGYEGAPFEMLKFRSMYVGAGDTQHRGAVARWISGTREPDTVFYKLSRDPRITLVGNIIRRTNLDELPQLINVVRNEMAIVGPRPAIDYEYSQYSERHMSRFAVRPGITGLWQVSGGHSLSFEEMIDLDLGYIASWSLIQDLRIMLKTIPLVVFARGH